jgi:acetylornithine deacetylase/succinyl-diaminopimelate desuccinylase-like protein
LFGGSVRNPANELARLLGGMHDEKGRITLPGFYDSVRPLDAQEREELSRLPVDEAFYLKQTGAPALWGEDGFKPVERVGARPTLDVNGLYSGWTGEGSKTVLPARAMAKLSSRLVPDQKPKEVYEQLQAYMQANASPGVTWEVKLLDESLPAITSRDSKATQALSDALETVWGKRPVFKREGGTIGIVGHMQKHLNADSVLTGFGLPDDNLHSPNEKLDLANWHRGIDALVHFFYNVAG